MKTSKFASYVFSCFFSFALTSSARGEWQIQKISTDASFRGLCVVDQNTVWAGGNKGTFVRTTDAGKSWHVGQVPGAGALDFRDVEALDGKTAWLLSIGEGSDSRIYKTTDGGDRWALQFQNERADAFFDALGLGRQKGSALVAVGPSGSDFRNSNGQWQKLDDAKYNLISVGRFNPQAVWAAGSKGRIARVIHFPE